MLWPSLGSPRAGRALCAAGPARPCARRWWRWRWRRRRRRRRRRLSLLLCLRAASFCRSSVSSILLRSFAFLRAISERTRICHVDGVATTTARQITTTQACAEKAFVEATPISGPAWRYTPAAVSRAIDEPTVLHTPRHRQPAGVCVCDYNCVCVRFVSCLVFVARLEPSRA